jgi:hypothetical protein
MQESERRAARRYSVALSVEMADGSAVTRDISASGVFFEANRSFNPGSPGAPLSFALVLDHADPAAPLRLECEGTIVRIEPQGPGTGVAATLTDFRMDLEMPRRPTEGGRSSGQMVAQTNGEESS